MAMSWLGLLKATPRIDLLIIIDAGTFEVSRRIILSQQKRSFTLFTETYI